MQQAKSIYTIVYHQLNDIPKKDWQSVAQSYNPFHDLKFLKVLEESEVEDADYYYLLFYNQNKKAIGSAVLSSFSIDLSLFVGKETLVQVAKKVFPKLFKVQILFCGTPVSIGHSNLQCIAQEDACLRELNQTMHKIAKQQKIKLLCIKELDQHKTRAYATTMKSLGWFEGHSIPDTKMLVSWSNYADYLSAIKSRYRRQIKQNLQQLSKDTTSKTEASDLIHQHVAVLKVTDIVNEDFFAKYLSVMDRAEIKLETLNLAFFASLQKQYADQLRYFVCQQNEATKSYALCLHQADQLHFLWTAKHQDKDIHQSYFNQLQAIVLYAMQHRVKQIHLGQTAYYPKMRIGAIPEERFLFFKSRNPIMNFFLKKMRKLIFPRLQLPDLVALKKTNSSSKVIPKAVFN